MREAEAMQRTGSHLRCCALGKILSERQSDSPQVRIDTEASQCYMSLKGFLVAGQAPGALGRFDEALQFFRHVMLAFPHHPVCLVPTQARIDIGDSCSREKRLQSKSTRDC